VGFSRSSFRGELPSYHIDTTGNAEDDVAGGQLVSFVLEESMDEMK